MLKFNCYRMGADMLIIILLSLPSVELSNPQSEKEASGKIWERIVTNLTIIDSYYAEGVPVDYSYNETSVNLYSDENENHIASAPGCPKSIDGVPWVQYGHPPRCYLVGYKGPCEFGEELLLESVHSNKAICACSSLKDENLEMLEKSDDRKYLFSSNSPYLLYDRGSKKCYYVQQQGPCDAGFVLIKLANSSTVKCLPEFRGQCGYNFEMQSCEELPPFGEGDGHHGGGGGGGAAFGGSVGHVLPNSCGKDENYSSTLDRCLKNGRGRGFVLG